jgi:hypothetical protein
MLLSPLENNVGAAAHVLRRDYEKIIFSDAPAGNKLGSDE